MEKGDIITIEIIDMTDDGKGIGRIDGMACFVDGAVFGDAAKVCIEKVKKNYALGKAVEIVSLSPHRASDASVCPYIDKCGGCAYGKLNYETQLKLKEKQVNDKLERIAGIASANVKPIIPMSDWDSNHTGYRNKAVMAVHPGDKGGPVIGFRARKSHRVVDCKTCKIQAKQAMTVAETFREYALRENDKLGWLKEITVKTAFSTGEVMVVLGVENTRKLPDLENLILLLDDAIDEPYSLESVAAFDGRKSEILAGKREIEDEICGLRFKISPESFYQVNPVQAERLYEKVMEYAGVLSDQAGDAPYADDKDYAPYANDKDHTSYTDDKLEVLDLYCGVGTIGLIAASRMNEKGNVFGVEYVKPAVLDANRNAMINGIVNALFIQGKAEEIIPEKVKTGEIKRADVVILDPPRRGCEPELLQSVIETKAKKIVYVSCDPATLARDLKFLIENGYEFIECTPVDMFCHSSHVESVSLLKKQ